MNDESSSGDPELPWELRLFAGLRAHEEQREPVESSLPARFEDPHLLGEGGMGQVLHAHDTKLGREVAVKRIPGGGGVEARERLTREARALARVRHPNVVAVHELLSHQGAWHLVMDYVRGDSLSDVLARRGPLAVDEAIAIALELTEGVACLHGSAIIHRDIKPANVLIDPSGHAVLLDLGISKFLDESDRISETGQLLGTPSHIAPEQIVGAQLDRRADVYGLGATLYHMLTGAPPHRGIAIDELLRRARTVLPPSPRELRSEVDSLASAICMRCLAKAPEKRYPTAADLAADLRRHRAGARSRRVGGRGVVGALLVCALLAATAWTLRPPGADVGRQAAALGPESTAPMTKSGSLAAAKGALEELKTPPPELRWAVALTGADVELDRNPAGLLAALRALPPPTDLSERRRALARSCYQRCADGLRARRGRRLSAQLVEEQRLYLLVGRALAPEEILPDRVAAALLQLVSQFEFRRDRLGFALALAAAAPENLEVQRSVGLLVSRLRAVDRVRMAPTLRRAIGLEEDLAARLRLEIVLCWMLAERAGAREAAREALALSERILPQLPDPLERSTVIMAQARSHRTLGNAPEALTHYDASIELHQGVAQAYSERAFVLRELGQPARAMSDLLRYLEVEHRGRIDQSPVLAAIWEIAREEGWHDRALPALKAELARLPRRPGWWIRLAWLQLREGLVQAARSSLGRAIESSDERTRALIPRVRELLDDLRLEPLDALLSELEALRGAGTDP